MIILGSELENFNLHYQSIRGERGQYA